MSNEVENVAPATVENEIKNGRKPFVKGKKINGMPASAANYPEYMTNMVVLLKNNAEIRRFTAIGIINYLLQKGDISGEHRFVSFKWDKFTVKYDGLMREYRYTEPFFLNALIASFTSFSASAQRTINKFTRGAMNKNMEDIASGEEVEAMVTAAESKANAVETEAAE